MGKKAAYGTTFAVNAGTAVAYIRSISGPGLSLDVADVTAHDSTGAWEEVVGTILRSGEITMEIAYDPANATHKNAANGWLALLVARAVTTFVLTLPTAAAFTGSGWVTGFEPSAPHDGALTANLKYKPTGALVTP